MENIDKELKQEKNSRSNLMLILIIGLIFIFLYYFLSVPYRLQDVSIHVSTNDSLSSIAKDLESKKVIKNSNILKSILYVISSDRHIPVGDYMFTKNENLLNVAWQLGRGVHNVEKIKVTLREGMTNVEMANLLSIKIPNFNKDLFFKDESVKQGYLFPDTYFFFPLTTTDEIIIELNTNFKRKISSIKNDLNSSGKNLEEIIIMASILEKEANGNGDISIISGILWKRIKKGMLLQVDAEPSTYKKVGLPENPISNPGLSSIIAAIKPIDTPYLFYLHDKDRNVHYAKDYSEHMVNIRRFLK